MRPQFEPGTLGDNFWRREKQRAEDVMHGFDRMPDYIQDHVREKNTTVGAKPKPLTIGAAVQQFMPAVAAFARARGDRIRNCTLAVDHTREAIVVMVNDQQFDFLSRQEIVDESYKEFFGARLNKILDDAS